MHRYRAWGLAALAAAAGATAAGAADPPPRAARPAPTTVYDKFFGKSRAKADPTPAPAGKGDVAATPPAGLPPDMKAAALRDEMDAFERRMAVCLKLREAAVERNDEAMLRELDEVERRATALYHARTAALGIPKTTPAADVLDRQLGTGVAVTPLTAPAPPTPVGPATAAARGTAPASGDPIREVRP